MSASGRERHRGELADAGLQEVFRQEVRDVHSPLAGVGPYSVDLDSATEATREEKILGKVQVALLEALGFQIEVVVGGREVVVQLAGPAELITRLAGTFKLELDAPEAVDFTIVFASLPVPIEG